VTASRTQHGLTPAVPPGEGLAFMKHKSLIAFLVLVTLGNLGTVLVMVIVVALLYATGQLNLQDLCTRQRISKGMKLNYEVKKYADCGSMFYCCLSSSGHRPHQVPQQVA
jgi:hypothetical protein